jgi:hypothetical protein
MSEDEDDPFEQFEADVGDREGDPFASFTDVAENAADGDDDADGEDGGDRGSLWDPDREEQLGSGPTDSHAGESTPPLSETARERTGDEPLSGIGDAGSDPLADGDSGGSQREGDPFESAEQAFEKMDVGELDVDDVWDTLADAEQRGSVTESEGHTYAEVSKHRYCEQCEHFSAPPEVACSHDGTEILEFVDLETVRLVDCPVVARRRELEEQD